MTLSPFPGVEETQQAKDVLLVERLAKVVTIVSHDVHNTMIIKFLPKIKNKIRIPPNERNLTQDTPDNLYYCKPKHIEQAKLILKQVTGKFKTKMNNAVLQDVNMSMNIDKKCIKL